MPPPPLPNHIQAFGVPVVVPTPVHPTISEQQQQLHLERERAEVVAIQQQNEIRALEVLKMKRDLGM